MNYPAKAPADDVAAPKTVVAQDVNTDAPEDQRFASDLSPEQETEARAIFLPLADMAWDQLMDKPKGRALLLEEEVIIRTMATALTEVALKYLPSLRGPLPDCFSRTIEGIAADVTQRRLLAFRAAAVVAAASTDAPSTL